MGGIVSSASSIYALAVPSTDSLVIAGLLSITLVAATSRGTDWLIKGLKKVIIE